MNELHERWSARSLVLASRPEAALGKGMPTRRQEEGGALILEKTPVPLCVPGTQELLGPGTPKPSVQGSSAPRVPLYPHLPCHFVSSLVPKLCGQADIVGLRRHRVAAGGAVSGMLVAGVPSSMPPSGVCEREEHKISQSSH